FGQIEDREMPAENPGRGVSLDALGTGVPAHHAAGGIEQVDRVVADALDQQAELGIGGIGAARELRSDFPFELRTEFHGRGNHKPLTFHAMLSIDAIRAAAARIQGAVERTPFLPSRTLSRLTGCELHLKFENLQFTASFKERGALNKLASLSDAERKRGVIAMSAGNHAQAVAYHASRLRIPAVIVMPKGSPNTKIKNTKVHGATVVLEGESLADAAGHARTLAKRDDLVFVHPYEDPLIIAGQGTVGLEMLQALPALDVVV